MQELTNDNTDTKLYCLFHIEYKDIDLITNKNDSNDYMYDAIFARAASLSFQHGGFVNKANVREGAIDGSHNAS